MARGRRVEAEVEMMRRITVLACCALLAIGLLGSARLAASSAARGPDGAWGERAPMLPRSEHSVAAANGRIFTLGGYSGERIASDVVQVYDAATDSWSFGTPLPLPLHHTMAASVDGRLYLIGG